MSSVSALLGVLDVFVWADVLFTRELSLSRMASQSLKIMVGYRCTCTRKTEREDQTLDVSNEFTTTTTVFLFISPDMHQITAPRLRVI